MSRAGFESDRRQTASESSGQTGSLPGLGGFAANPGEAVALGGILEAATLDRKSSYPVATDPERVGSYPAIAGAGGGYVWDAVLEYRVWCHPERGAPDTADGSDYYYSFATYEQAVSFCRSMEGAEEPLALVLQEEHVNEPEPGRYEHIKELHQTESPVQFLWRPRRTSETIPDFLSPDAPANRLDIIRGLAEQRRRNRRCPVSERTPRSRARVIRSGPRARVRRPVLSRRKEPGTVLLSPWGPSRGPNCAVLMLCRVGREAERAFEVTSVKRRPQSSSKLRVVDSSWRDGRHPSVRARQRQLVAAAHGGIRGAAGAIYQLALQCSK